MSLDFGTIKKRDIYFSNSNDSVSSTIHESVVRMDITNVENAIKHVLEGTNTNRLNPHINTEMSITPQIERYTDVFLGSINNPENAGRYIDECVIFISELDKISESYADNVLDTVISNIIPKSSVSDLNRVKTRLNENVYGYITEAQSKKITDAINSNIVASRILENHNKISKRFNIDNEFSKMKAKGLSRMVEYVSDVVNTYRIEPYQKLNICIEESVYLFGKYGYEYNKADLVREALEDIMLTNELDLHNLKGYRKAINESYVLDDTDTNKVYNIIKEDFSVTDDCIDSYIDGFLMNPDKNYASLIALSIKIARECSYLDIRSHIDKFIFLLRKASVYDIIDEKGIEDCLKNFVDTLSSREDLESHSIEDLISSIKNTIGDLRFTAGYTIDADKTKSDCVANQCTSYVIPTLQSTKNMYYDRANLESIRFFENDPTQIPLNEFKIFKFNNLIRASFNLDKYLKIKGRQLMKKPKEKVASFIRKARNVLFGEGADKEEALKHFGACLTEDHIPDICVAIYEYNDESELEVKEFLSEVCKSYNDNLLVNNVSDMKSYYIMNPGVAEVHLRENVEIVDEDGDLEKELSFEEAFYINLFSDSMELLEDASINHLDSVERFITEFCTNKNSSKEAFDIALESMSILGVDEHTINIFNTMYRNNHSITEVTDLSSYKPVDQNLVSENDRLEAFNTLGALLEAEMKKPKVGAAYWNDDEDEDDDYDDDDYDDEDDEEEDSKSSTDNKSKNKPAPGGKKHKMSAKDSKKKFGVNLNDLKLAMMGMKQKFQDMGQKEKELSKNLDNNVRILVKGMKDALISDRREAIIKGSVIPSFSKCIKIAIGLAGIGVLINPGAAVIAAIGGFALSKHLTEKERVLLLDDIEVELDVLEKEISLAESRNQMNKYRALMKYKKDLQRQYQRIKYNIRIGKDILPDSSMGLKNTD